MTPYERLRDVLYLVVISALLAIHLFKAVDLNWGPRSEWCVGIALNPLQIREVDGGECHGD